MIPKVAKVKNFERAMLGQRYDLNLCFFRWFLVALWSMNGLGSFAPSNGG